ncbi:hypothetical protein TTRE_0000848501 [Trichuris trichiura]|uniref:Uncharacterized protein n=1 Tax=Trichuris trichiura TaxID=36087 RepID=A0A077ZIC7_TRITR|nr:hypothetical protein TTRE_0000848501 [Trichuris trichiura]
MMKASFIVFMVTVIASSNGTALYKTVHEVVATGIGVRPITTTFVPRRTVESQRTDKPQLEQQQESSSELAVSTDHESKNSSVVMKNILDEYMHFFEGPKKATLLRKLLRQKIWTLLLLRLG